jgi:SAM-dependent methyltransferase
MWRADTAMGRYLLQREIAFIRRILGAASRPHRLLEVGCGRGQITLALRDAGLPVVGLDIDPLALVICQSQANGTPLLRSQVPHLPFADGSFDCVIAIESVGFFAHAPFLQESNRLLCDGGLLIFDAVNERSYRWALRRLLGRSVTRRVKRLLDRAAGVDPTYKTATDTGPYMLSCRDVLQVTAEQGFDVQEVSGYNWMPFDVRSNSALVAPAARLERALRLDRYARISPWFLVAARKRDTAFWQESGVNRA